MNKDLKNMNAMNDDDLDTVVGGLSFTNNATHSAQSYVCANCHKPLVPSGAVPASGTFSIKCTCGHTNSFEVGNTSAYFAGDPRNIK